MKKSMNCVFAALLLAIPRMRAHAAEADDPHASLTDAVCVLRPTKGNKSRGVLTLKQHDGYVHIRGRVRNLTPGKHGFHIHALGDLRGTDGLATGGHYAPQGHDHGGPDEENRHAGDLGNIEANDNGVAWVDVNAKGLMLYAVIGRSFVVHGGEDDLKSQPSGNAGPRVAVGVIGIAEPGE